MELGTAQLTLGYAEVTKRAFDSSSSFYETAGRAPSPTPLTPPTSPLPELPPSPTSAPPPPTSNLPDPPPRYQSLSRDDIGRYVATKAFYKEVNNTN
uniref:Uncharacterized protein n=1 Tax=Angiostrongylus cantonensis TaxID=6313 RepID=A0A0K0D416_ANGCA